MTPQHRDFHEARDRYRDLRKAVDRDRDLRKARDRDLKLLQSVERYNDAHKRHREDLERLLWDPHATPKGSVVFKFIFDDVSLILWRQWIRLRIWWSR